MRDVIYEAEIALCGLQPKNGPGTRDEIWRWVDFFVSCIHTQIYVSY
jgi:hypothetical protein